MKTNRSKHGLITLMFAALLCCMTLSAYAQNIYLNGTDITKSQLKNQKLERVQSVEFDADGNIHIDAPAYHVEGVGGTSSETTKTDETTPAPPSTTTTSTAVADQKEDDRSAPMVIHYAAKVTMANRYLLTLDNPDRGNVPFDVDVLINGKHATTLSYLRGSASIDVSEYMTRGDNTVSFVAHRNLSAENHGAGYEMKVMVGVGAYDGKVARYEHILVGMNYKSADNRSSIRNSQTFKVE